MKSENTSFRGIAGIPITNRRGLVNDVALCSDEKTFFNIKVGSGPWVFNGCSWGFVCGTAHTPHCRNGSVMEAYWTRSG